MSEGYVRLMYIPQNLSFNSVKKRPTFQQYLKEYASINCEDIKDIKDEAEIMAYDLFTKLKKEGVIQIGGYCGEYKEFNEFLNVVIDECFVIGHGSGGGGGEDAVFNLSTPKIKNKILKITIPI